MRLFIGYGYNERDKWVETYVIPFVQAFGWEVVHGKAVYGGALPDEIVKLIRTADAMVGFTTRRDPAGADQFYTHSWVVQELTAAYSQVPPIPFVEVRENGVISPGGIIEAVGAQRIDYQQSDLATCLLRIAQALRRFSDQTRVITVRLGPAAAVEQISPFLDDAAFSCRCQTLNGTVISPPQPTPVLPIRGGLFLQLRGLAPGELVRVTISAGGRTWRSSFESVDTVDMQVKE